MKTIIKWLPGTLLLVFGGLATILGFMSAFGDVTFKVAGTEISGKPSDLYKDIDRYSDGFANKIKMSYFGGIATGSLGSVALLLGVVNFARIKRNVCKLAGRIGFLIFAAITAVILFSLSTGSIICHEQLSNFDYLNDIKGLF